MEHTSHCVGAAYIRVSDERQDEYSPDSQLKKIREHASSEGYAIPDEFVFYDDGISGKSAVKRADFNRMIALAKEKEHPFDRIYVWKFSRFARNQEESMVYKNLLRKRSVSVVSVSEPIPEGHFGTLIERIIEWMDEFYLINLGAEVMRGMTEKASRGEPTCAPPFGYVMTDGRYYPDEKSGGAETVREIFTLFSSGFSQREIAKIMCDRGIRTQRGNAPDSRWIDYILHNHCYIGKIRWTPDGSKAVSRRRLDNENIMIVDGLHRPLISDELWNTVQARLSDRQKARPKYARCHQSVQYMLKGLVRCSSCGGTVALSSAVSGKSRTRTLQCCRYSRGTCQTSHSVTLPKLENALIGSLRKLFGDATFTVSPTRKADFNRNAVDCGKLIAAEKRRLKRAYEAYLVQVDTVEQYATTKKEIEKRIELLEKQMSQAAATGNSIKKKTFEISKFLEDPSVTPKAKNELLRTLIDRAVYDSEKRELAVYLRELSS